MCRKILSFLEEIVKDCYNQSGHFAYKTTVFLILRYRSETLEDNILPYGIIVCFEPPLLSYFPKTNLQLIY